MLIMPSDFQIGKVILYQENNFKLVLAFRGAEDFDWWLEQFDKDQTQEILSSILLLPQHPDFDRCFGFHKDIPHQGKVLGGGIAVSYRSVMKRQTLLINGTSLAFGPMPNDLVRQVLDEYSQQQERFEYFIGN